MPDINNLSLFAAGGTSKIGKNNVDMSTRNILSNTGIDFKNDNKLTNDEMRLLKKEFGMDEAQVKEWVSVEGGMEFLNAMLHAQGSTKDEIKANREQVAKQFLLKDRVYMLGSSDANLIKQLKVFGVDINEATEYVQDNWLNKEYPIKTITPDPSFGETTVVNVRLHFPNDINGNASKNRIDLFDASKDYDTLNANASPFNPDFKGTLLLESNTGVYIKYSREANKDHEYYRLNGEQGLVRISKETYEQIKAEKSCK